MKKILTVILYLSLTACLAGCSSDTEIPDIVDIDMTAAEEQSENEAYSLSDSAETEGSEKAEETETEYIPPEISWQDEYTQYINELDLYYGFYIGDINGDEIPEAVIAVNPYEMTTILYPGEYGLNVIDLETESTWGSVRYISDTGQILFSPFHGYDNGAVGYYIYDWNGCDYEVSYILTRDIGNFFYTQGGDGSWMYDQGYINGEDVNSHTFEKKLKKIQELEENNSYFPIKTVLDDDLESYMQEFLPDLRLIDGMEENFKYNEEDNNAAL